MIYALFPGGFKPPHLGHLKVVETILKKKPDIFYIIISKKPRLLIPPFKKTYQLTENEIKEISRRYKKSYNKKLLEEDATSGNIPAITATQLGRGAYKIQSSDSLNLDQMSESVKKIDHADFVCLLAKDSIDKNTVHGKVGKNRSGEANINILFKTNFPMFKFVSGTKRSNIKKQDISEVNVFPGLSDKKF